MEWSGWLKAVVLIAAWAALHGSVVAADPGGTGRRVRLADFLPEGHVLDGSASYMSAIQRALDLGGERHVVILFEPGVYFLDNAAGFLLKDNTTLELDGVRFEFAEPLTEDGQAFRGRDLRNVTFRGGEIVGKRDAWAASTNIGGIRIHGACTNIRVYETRFADLSSNAIGIFAEDAAHPASDVRVRDVVAVNCCNYYGDYLDEDIGPAKGSDRLDQGGVAFYHVDDWCVDGCCFEGSQSDGTHFFQSHRGRFSNNRVVGSKMGGYFLEGCRQVIASGNFISRNGSRGVTIERDSMSCTLANNVVEYSGREGLWAPDVASILVADNIFRLNGRKADGSRSCEIRIDNGDKYDTDTRDIRVSGNLFYTDGGQLAGIYISENVARVTIRHNGFRGPVKTQHIAWDKANTKQIVVDANDLDAEARMEDEEE